MIKLTGLIPAVYTPFHEDGSLNLKQIQPYADLLIADGADGVFVCGSTGECASMTVEERKIVLEAWVQAVAGRMHPRLEHYFALLDRHRGTLSC